MKASRYFTTSGTPLSTFDQVIQSDPQCAMAYWGAAMTYNHPFCDAPTKADEQKAWALVQKGMRAQEKSNRETNVSRCGSRALQRWRRWPKVRTRPAIAIKIDARLFVGLLSISLSRQSSACALAQLIR